jgi:hypothetical protein
MANFLARHTGRFSIVAIVFMLAGAIALPATSQASPVEQGAGQGQAPASITIPANGSVTIQVRGFCLDFGEPFPTVPTNASGPADAKIRQALNYAVSKGYTEGNPEQVQQAIWFLRDNQWRSEDRTIAQEIVNNATDANNPNDGGSGTSLAAAISGGQASVTSTFTPQTQDAFYGDGNAEIRNLTGSELTVFMPIGVVFTAGAGGNFQDLVGYQLATGQTEVQGTPQVTAQATITLQPTAQPTITAITTPIVETPAPAPTETFAPASTATTAPAGQIATAAPAATETPSVPAPDTNPSTGVADHTSFTLAMFAMLLAVSSIVVGMALRRSENS